MTLVFFVVAPGENRTIVGDFAQSFFLKARLCGLLFFLQGAECGGLRFGSFLPRLAKSVALTLVFFVFAPNENRTDVGDFAQSFF